jgi:hypothetical protein
MENYDVIIIGAGAAGLMCAIEAGKRGRKVWLVDHYKKVAEKIRISGGGRCNFTNIHTSPETYISNNPHFCKSALKQYTQNDFIALVEKHKIAYHEKTLGQLFCDDSSQNIIDMLLTECDQAGVKLSINTHVADVTLTDGGLYELNTSAGLAQSSSLVIACGGLSIPKIGATNFGYTLAKQFGLNVLTTRAALVPLTFQDDLLQFCKNLTGLSVDAIVSCNKTQFREGLLFTHRGLSGPSILQISSYWHEGEEIEINFAPDIDVLAHLKELRQSSPKQDIQTALSSFLPKRLAAAFCEKDNVSGRIADMPNTAFETIAQTINSWRIPPAGTEGYRTAEVTIQGVDTNELSSKTMEAKKQENLYLIGEVVDVTGHLGGFNFQWAWSSGYVAGQYA